MQEFLTNYFGLSYELQLKILESGLVIIIIVLLRILISKLIIGKVTDIKVRYQWQKISLYLSVFLIIVFLINIWLKIFGSMATFFGLISAGIAIALKDPLVNMVAWFFIIIRQPFKVGDRVTVGETEGDVIDVNIRSTTVRSLSNISIIVPNSEFISGRVTNWSHGDLKVRINLAVGVSYNSDLDLVIRSLKEVAAENKEVLDLPAPDVHLKSFGDSSWDMVLRVWIADPKRYYGVQSDLNCAIVKKFRTNNIEIPFPQRDLHIRTQAVG